MYISYTCPLWTPHTRLNSKVVIEDNHLAPIYRMCVKQYD